MLQKKHLKNVAHFFVLPIIVGSIVCCLLICYFVHKSTARQLFPARRIQEHRLFGDILRSKFSAQTVSFYTDDNVQLAGLLIVRPGASRNIILCHGYRMTKERMHRFALMFPKDNILLFDYRAHGESGGKWTTIGHHEKKDVLAAAKFLNEHEHTKNIPIVGIGVSMGAVSLLAAATQSELFKAIILDSPFCRLDEQTQRMVVRRHKLPHFPFGMLVQNFFERMHQFQLQSVNSIECAQNLNVPVLMIHSQQDKTVPVQDAHRIYERINSSKELWIVSKSGHARIFTEMTDEYAQRVHSFFERLHL
jgi:hypothetical protein